jgi:ABC-2 type transport system ATP-binding protein
MMIAEIRGVPGTERNKRIEEAVSDVRMEEWMDKRVGKFSKGMKQRICIASALLSDPSILLLDEPTNGLDPRGMSEVRGIVKSLRSKERLIFMSSHILSEVSEVCDEVAMIDHGKLIVYDTISNVTAKFIGGDNIVEVELQRPIDSDLTMKKILGIPSIVAAQRRDDRNLTITFSGGVDSQEKILSDLVKMNIGVISYRPASSGLEDAYLKLITATL